jgi:hypothetical protein
MKRELLRSHMDLVPRWSSSHLGSLSWISWFIAGLTVGTLWSPCAHGADGVRPSRFYGGGQYAVYSGGTGIDVPSRTMAGANFEVEFLQLPDPESWSVLTAQNFDLESNTMVQFFIAAGYARYAFDPLRPFRLTGQSYSVAQSPLWNARLQIYAGLGRQVLQSFLRFGELEAATETVEAGLSLSPLLHIAQHVSIWTRFDGRYTFGIGKYDVSGLTASVAFGVEWGL